MIQATIDKLVDMKLFAMAGKTQEMSGSVAASNLGPLALAFDISATK
jgi:hypothetical protein